jgi:hypothetical protein
MKRKKKTIKQQNKAKSESEIEYLANKYVKSSSHTLTSSPSISGTPSFSSTTSFPTLTFGTPFSAPVTTCVVYSVHSTGVLTEIVTISPGSATDKNLIERTLNFGYDLSDKMIIVYSQGKPIQIFEVNMNDDGKYKLTETTLY